MKNYLFMNLVLSWLSDGKVFRNGVAVLLRIVAVLLAIIWFVLWLVTWKLVFELPATGILGGVIFQVLFAVAGYMVCHTILIRARNITELPEWEFSVIPISSILFKLLGELYASFMVVTSIGAGILLWFAGTTAQRIFRDIPGIYAPVIAGQGFVAGILVMAFGMLIAFVVLMLAYLLSESVVVAVEIARNTRVTREIAEKYDPEPGGEHRSVSQPSALEDPRELSNEH